MMKLGQMESITSNSYHVLVMGTFKVLSSCYFEIYNILLFTIKRL
jgi:hypothetical protein